MDILHPAALAPLVPTYGGRAARDHYTQHGLSAQYELGVERQLTLDGRAEPVRGRERPEPVAPVVDDRTGLLFGPDGSRSQTGLDRHGNNLDAPPLGDASYPRGTYLAAKFDLRDRLEQHLDRLPYSDRRWTDTEYTLGRIARCGNAVAPGDGFVTFHAGPTGRATVGGVLWCGRWLCPTCYPFIQNRRREALAPRVPIVEAAGDSYMLTLTLRHHRGGRYKELTGALSSVYTDMTRERWWNKATLAALRVDEATWSEKNGFHPHKHVITTLGHGADGDAFADKVQWFFERGLRKLGRTCDWTDDRAWFSRIAPGDVGQASTYLQKLTTPPDDAAEDMHHIMATEILGGSAKPGAQAWTWPVEPFTEAFVDSKGQRTFGTSKLWRTPKTEAVELDEDAAAQREESKPVFAKVSRSDFRATPAKVRRQAQGFIHQEDRRPDWLAGLSAAYGDGLVVLCQPGETPPPAPDDDGGCGGDAPTVAPEAAVGASQTNVAPVPGSARPVDEAPRKLAFSGELKTQTGVNSSPILKNPTVAPRSRSAAALCSERSVGEVGHGSFTQQRSGR